jgi:four helix bundle protein
LVKEVSPMTMPHDHRSTSPAAPGAGRFPHEALDCYHVAREIVAFVAQHRRQLHGLPGEAGPQLERACVRALLNTAEAAGRQGVRDRARVFAIARGETCEAAAALDIAVLFGALTAAEVAPARTLLVRLGQMLTRLARPT